jgi:homoserine/homoserine lactone efflux protein
VSVTTWWIFATTELVLCLTPGPAVLFVLSTALRVGARRSVAANLGILCTNTVYFALSATGVGAVLAASYNLFFAVKWLGAAYLIFLGIRTVFGSSSLLETQALPAHRSGWRLFGDGFLLQASNPKAIIFFSALVPQFIDTRAGVVSQVAILGATSLFIEFFILLGYGLVAGRASQFARQPGYATWTNRIAGMLLIGAGAGLATLRKT